jgi:hypothetical protein
MCTYSEIIPKTAGTTIEIITIKGKDNMENMAKPD